ncbi:MAG: HAD-IA family hydrolase [Acidimicrobiales bacterium]
MNWLLCDYGGVLARQPSAADRSALEAETEAGGHAFWAAYWQYRPAYDRSDIDTARYWTQVLGHTPGTGSLRRIVELDTLMWSRPNQASLDAANGAADAGVRLAVLSNAPAQLATQFDRLPWLAPFSPRLFSGQVGMIKPEPAIYTLALRALHAIPQEVTFVDDRLQNIVAARRAGLQATLFTDPDQLFGGG